MTQATELARLEDNLNEALKAFDDAERLESRARSARCDAQNTLNTAQKQLDAYVHKLRQSAPTDSDWGRGRRVAARAA